MGRAGSTPPPGLRVFRLDLVADRAAGDDGHVGKGPAKDGVPVPVIGMGVRGNDIKEFSAGGGSDLLENLFGIGKVQLGVHQHHTPLGLKKMGIHSQARILGRVGLVGRHQFLLFLP